MEFGDVVRRRRMVRSYDPDRPLPAGLLDQVVDVARRAPSAGFTQGVSFLLLGSVRERGRFWAATSGPGEPDRWLRGMRTAPGLIIVLCSPAAYQDRYAMSDKGWTDRSAGRWAVPYWFVDAGMAAMASLYAVVDADPAGDLGACFFGVPADRVDAVRRAFGVPVDQEVAGVISVGYRAAGEGPSGSPRRRGRKPRSEVVRYGHWEGRDVPEIGS
jgi:nitroreductase